jgi:hypothetical protein
MSRTGPKRTIRCRDLPGPEGAYAVLPDGLHELDDVALAALAHNAMLLALHPDHARRLMEEHGQNAAGQPIR